MTVEEALKELGVWYAGFADKPSEEAIKTVMDATGKQIPKKPVSGCCPDCGVLLKKFAPYTYCAKCGRKLDAPWCGVEK